VILRSQCREACVTIEIVDRGSGIPKEHHGDIFSPFVTTKKEGTGLGLPIVKKIIEAHKGSINIINNNEKGVTFRITIPLAFSTRR
jgi:signal transduction histidine kinase